MVCSFHTVSLPLWSGSIAPSLSKEERRHNETTTIHVRRTDATKQENKKGTHNYRATRYFLCARTHTAMLCLWTLVTRPVALFVFDSL
jgi:hypothetical protein